MPLREPIVVSDLNVLRDVVREAIRTYGPSVDLNFIDVGKVSNFTELFKGTQFCGDVSRWNMANANDTDEMFAYTPFNGDLSKWNLKSLYEANGMFKNSLFNGNISQWRIKHIVIYEHMKDIFKYSAFAQDLTSWHMSDKREHHELSTAGVFSSDIPTQQALQHNSVMAYIKLFGDESGLLKYLARTPFSVMHFDTCCVFENCPASIPPEDFQWSRNLLDIGSGLGLDNVKMRQICVDQLRARAMGAQSFSLDGMLNQN